MTGDIVLLDIRTSDLTLSQVMSEVSRWISEMPDHEIFMDGDARAIVARPKGAGA